MIEILIVAVLVFWSAVVVFKKVFPKTSGAFFLKLSNACTEKGWHGLAKWLKPAAAAVVVVVVAVMIQINPQKRKLKSKR